MANVTEEWGGMELTVSQFNRYFLVTWTLETLSSSL